MSDLPKKSITRVATEPSKNAMEEARRYVYVNQSEPVEIVVFGTVYVYSKTADAKKAVELLTLKLAQSFDEFHSSALGLSIWRQPLSDES